jgi:TolB-like protein/Tfp pilus assembly protein PilF
MQPAAPQISICPGCGRALEETSGGGLGCMVCLLRVGISGEDERDIGICADHGATETFEGDEHFGVYEIDRREDGSFYELGHGAMGVTYRATDTSLQRKVALKIIKLDVARGGTEARERFLREARAAAALRHENIATVFQFGIREETGQCFYAMELIEGETLEENVRRVGPLDARATIEIAEEVASALAAAEKRGLIHRDLKPSNLMLVEADHPDLVGRDRRARRETPRRVPTIKIIDFGLAKVLSAPADPTRLTHDGFVGTPAFASPEQFEHAALDARSDIYSLGVTLWFALTGKTPFAGHSVEEIHRARKTNALPLEQLKAAHVPSRLRSLLKSMLAFEPAARPSTHELAAQLQRCTAQASGKRRTRMALAAAAILILGASAFFVFHSLRTHPLPAESATSPAPSEKSIAVLPFQNRSEEKENAYFADAVQDEILTRLSKIADLKVISRTSTQHYKSAPGNLSEVARELGVAHILEGTVQKRRDAVRVNVQLIKAADDSHLWAETYDRKLTDIFGVESEIAKGIAESLQAKLTTTEKEALAVKPTNDSEAYDAYLRGLAFEARSRYPFLTGDLAREGIGFYERAVQLDPNFAAAWARLSRAHAFLYFGHADTTPASRRDAAKSALENAKRLEPNSPETLLALGYYQYHVLSDYGAAKTTFERVSRMLPNSSDVLLALARIARREGHWDQSVVYDEQALILDPRNRELLGDTSWNYTMLRQFPAALKVEDRVLDITPDNPTVIASKASIYQAEGNLQEAARLLAAINEQTPSVDTFLVKVTQLRLERNYREAGQLFQARSTEFHFDSDDEKAFYQLGFALVQRLAGGMAGAKITAEQTRKTLEPLYRDKSDDLFLTKLLSLSYALIGQKELALKLAERGVMLLPSAKNAVDGPAVEENLAVIQTMFGENSRAILTLTRLLQTPGNGWLRDTPITPALLRLDPIWDPLRADPAFQKLCEEKQTVAPDLVEKDAPDKSIAVLPFENLSHDREDSFFADGVQDDVLTKLAKIADLKVISRTSVMQYRGNQDLRHIAAALGVSHVLEGTVRRSNGKVHINAQLVDARTDTHVWAEEYDRDLNNVFAIEAELAQSIANQLRARVSASEDLAMQERSTSDLVAFDLYTRAKNLVLTASSRSTGRTDLLQAVDQLNQAIAHDPSFLQAYCQLASAHDHLYSLGFDRTPARLELANVAIQAAFRLRPDAGETHLARAENLYRGYLDYGGALADLEVARQSLPNDARILQLMGFIQRRQRRWQEATQNLERAVELDPRNTYTLQQMAWQYLFVRRYAEIKSLLAHVLAIEPNRVDTQVLLASVDFHWKADIRPFHQMIDSIRATNPSALSNITDAWLTCALAERDPVAATDAMEAAGENAFGDDTVQFSRTFFEGVIARMVKDEGKARSAFTAARAEQEKIIQAQPNYGPPLCVLGLIDAGLGRKQEALREGRRAVELLPMEKDSINGTRMIKYLAMIAAWVGDKDLACEQLASAIHHPTSPSYGDLKLLPFWDPLRGDPRFEQIVASLAPK